MKKLALLAGCACRVAPLRGWSGMADWHFPIGRVQKEVL